MNHSSTFIGFVCLFTIEFCLGQTVPQTLDTITLTATRIETSLDRVPAAIAVVSLAPEDAIRQQTSLQEYVQQIPGVFTQNATNFAQDLRISIRGFGARSAFGIRGIKLIVDGIPETTPDGQGQLDNLNLPIIERIEVIKGPSSSLYGNASGGVISIETQNKVDAPFANWRASGGSFGYQNYQVTAGLNSDNHTYIFHANYIESDGYRDQSRNEQYATNFKGIFRLNENTTLTTLLNYSDSPVAEDPGGLTAEEVAQNRRQARSRNLDFETREAIRQLKAGLRLAWDISNKWDFNSYVFYNNRRFDGKLPFEFGGVVDLSRNYLGQGSSVTYQKQSNTVQLGYDIGYQSDDRQRFENLGGIIGNPTLDQKERFTNIGLYMTDHLKVSQWLFTAGLRFDYNQLKSIDQFISDGDDSGSLTLNAFNPSIGISYTLTKVHTLFSNVSTSFETPALSELSANPTGQGFNQNLKPQKAINYELGWRGQFLKQLSFEVVGFLSSTRDDLVPFELADFPDRDFFRNAGKTERKGVELAMSYAFNQHWRLSTAYSYADFKYTDYQIGESNFEGNALPGLPNATGSIQLHYRPMEGFHASLNATLVGSQFGDDANTTEIEGYVLVNLRAGYLFRKEHYSLRPFIGIQNLLDSAYTDNVRINAFGGRFFEPAPTLHAFGGIILQL